MRLKLGLRLHTLCAWLALCLLAAPARGGGQTNGVTQVELGQAVVALHGPWSFHLGDDSRWAQQDFDDSQWATMDLTPPAGSYDRLIGTMGFVPGWTARGYHGYTGYAWYRLRVNVKSTTADAVDTLALKMPDNCDDAYQVFVNGIFLGELGKFTDHGVKIYVMRPRAYVLPKGVSGGPITIAIRVWMNPGTPLVAFQAGGLHGPPMLGENTVIQAAWQMDWDAIDHTNYSHAIEGVTLLLALFVVVALARLDRDEPTYLWLGLACAVTVAILGLILGGDYTRWITRTSVAVLQDDVLFPARIGLWIIFWGYWFRFARIRRLHQITWALVLMLALGTALQRPPLYGTLVPAGGVAWLLPLTIAIKLMLGALLVWVAYYGINRDWADALLAMPAVVLVGVAQYHYELFLLNVKVYYFPFGYRIALSQVGIILSMLIITVLLMRRFLKTLQEREQWRHEIEQARQVQSVLVPAKLPVTPGFALESVYRPALQVGGDFFHVRPEEDGSLLLVVGDVSGKGLRAAMTASTIIGALRNETPGRPVEEVLARLNRVLVGQIGGFVTCCVAHITTNGVMTIANAGHLAPYLDGEELLLKNSIPLGLDPAASFEASKFILREKEQLTLMTDGVVEARSRSGELFGFARAGAMSQHPASAIAQAAQEFGQDDDITVLTVTRVAEQECVAQRPGPTLSPSIA